MSRSRQRLQASQVFRDSRFDPLLTLNASMKTVFTPFVLNANSTVTRIKLTGLSDASKTFTGKSDKIPVAASTSKLASSKATRELPQPTGNSELGKLTTAAKALETEFKTKMKTPSFAVYNEAFSKTIQKNRIFTKILSRAKAYFDRLLASSLDSKEYLEYSSKLHEKSKLQQETQQLSNENRLSRQRLKELGTKNSELCRNFQALESQYSSLQSKLNCFSTQNSQAPPQSHEAWKYLLAENHNYKSLVKSLRSERFERYKRELHLFNLLHAIKQRGYAVNKMLQVSPEPFSSSSSCTERAPSPLPVFSRPSVVPPLRLSSLSPSSSDSSTD